MASLRGIAPERVGQLRILLEEVVALSGFDAGTPPMFLEGTKQTTSNAQPGTATSKSKLLKHE